MIQGGRAAMRTTVNRDHVGSIPTPGAIVRSRVLTYINKVIGRAMFIYSGNVMLRLEDRLDNRLRHIDALKRTMQSWDRLG